MIIEKGGKFLIGDREILYGYYEAMVDIDTVHFSKTDIDGEVDITSFKRVLETQGASGLVDLLISEKAIQPCGIDKLHFNDDDSIEFSQMEDYQ